MSMSIGQCNGVGSRSQLGRRARRRLVISPHGSHDVEDSRPLQRGFSLLEIILALAILAGSLAALGEVMRLADQNSALARDETQAQIIAASVMDELVAGARLLEPLNRVPLDYETDPLWLCSIAVEQTAYAELVAVRILVEQQADARLQPPRFELVRWLPNPDYVPAETSTSSTSSAGFGGQSAGGVQ